MTNDEPMSSTNCQLGLHDKCDGTFVPGSVCIGKAKCGCKCHNDKQEERRMLTLNWMDYQEITSGKDEDIVSYLMDIIQKQTNGNQGFSDLPLAPSFTQAELEDLVFRCARAESKNEDLKAEVERLKKMSCDKCQWGISLGFLPRRDHLHDFTFSLDDIRQGD